MAVDFCKKFLLLKVLFCDMIFVFVWFVRKSRERKKKEKEIKLPNLDLGLSSGNGLFLKLYSAESLENKQTESIN